VPKSNAYLGHGKPLYDDDNADDDITHVAGRPQLTNCKYCYR